MIHYGGDDEVFLGRDLGHTRGYSEKMASLIDTEVKNIIDQCYQGARQIIEEYMDVLHKSAQLLLKEEKIDQHQFEALFEGHPKQELPEFVREMKREPEVSIPEEVLQAAGLSAAESLTESTPPAAEAAPAEKI